MKLILKYFFTNNGENATNNKNPTTEARQPRFNLETLDHRSTKELYTKGFNQKLQLQ